MHSPAGPLPLPTALRRADASDTMQAWEQFLTGGPDAPRPAANFVVSSWQRSLQSGVNPISQAAPLAALGDDLVTLQSRYADLMLAAADAMQEAAGLLEGTGSIMVLTDPGGVVLQAVGDHRTLDQAGRIHLTLGGVWKEDVIGTNGIGTALATGRPAQVHAAEHFCDGIKGWTCAGAPIFEPGTTDILGVVDISGPPSTYAQNNLTLAVTTARRIEAALGGRLARERMRLLEVCLTEISGSRAAGLVALNRAGRLVHASGRIPAAITVGERMPGLDRDVPVAQWADRLPEEWRPDWLNPVLLDDQPIGAVLVIPSLVVPGKAPSGVSRAPLPKAAGGCPRNDFDRIIRRSRIMDTLVGQASRLAGRRVPLLIEGETGVGKHLLAREIHDAGGERRPYVTFNCAAMPKDILAAELFGQGAAMLAGARKDGRPGRLELAHQGTLCVEDPAEIPLELQSVLLRVLEEGVVYRLGDPRPRPVDVRLIAMTNRDLRADVETGAFRQGLYNRICVTSLKICPLRERREDIDVLVDHFNQQLAVRHHVAPRTFAPPVIQVFHQYHWPGNVRELRNLIERLLLTENRAEVALDELPFEIRHSSNPAFAAASPTLDTMERETILRAIHQEGGNILRAARRLGISRSTIYRKIGRYEGGAAP